MLKSKSHVRDNVIKGDVRLTRTFLRLLNTSNLRPQESRSRHRRMSVSNL